MEIDLSKFQHILNNRKTITSVFTSAITELCKDPKISIDGMKAEMYLIE